jgi:hypothetical protein
MQCMMLIYESTDIFATRNNPDKAPAYWGAWMSYVKAINEAGIVVSGHGLMPPETATSLRMPNGQRQVQDGPFADTKEALGGYFILEVPSMEVALDWAARCPAMGVGGVELRPVLPPPPAG